MVKLYTGIGEKHRSPVPGSIRALRWDSVAPVENNYQLCSQQGTSNHSSAFHTPARHLRARPPRLLEKT